MSGENPGDCVERVAYDMAKDILNIENQAHPIPGSEIRKEFLTLYRQCLKVTKGGMVKQALAAEC